MNVLDTIIREQRLTKTTIEKLSERTGISKTSIGHYLLKRANPTIENVVKLCKALEIREEAMVTAIHITEEEKMEQAIEEKVAAFRAGMNE